MARKRATRSSFGGTRQLASGRWQAYYVLDGVNRTAPKTPDRPAGTFATKAQADAWLATVSADLQRGAWVAPEPARRTLAEYATAWLDERRRGLRPTTAAKYDHLLRNHVLPVLGGQRLAQLSPATVRSWYRDLATQADDSYRLLRAVLNTAVADGMLAKSPCTVKGAGSVRSAERPTASVAEVAAVLAAAPERFRAAFALESWCSLRRGEVLGLQRRHVNPLKGTVTVEQAYVPPMGGKAQIGPPKTEAGRRTLFVPENVLPLLVEHLDRFVGSGPDAWLFGTANGTPVSPRNLQRAWDATRKAAGRPDLHMHDLRHSGLTWAATTGATTAELMAQGGHANPRAALRYQHATEERSRALADALAGLAAKPTPIGAARQA